MSTVRGVKDRRFKFVQLLNSMFEDPEISLKAKGFIGYCLTKTENWHFHVSHLCSVLKEGEKAIYSVINECISHGYAIRYQKRREDGEYDAWETIVSDSKIEIEAIKKELEEKGLIQKSSTVACFGDAGNGVAEKVPPSNTNSSNTKKEQQHAAAPIAAVFSESEKKERATLPIYDCLKSVNIPDKDKSEITRRFDENTVKNAIAWATHPDTVISKGLAPAIKWACQEKPETPKNKEETERLNKEFAMRYDGRKTNTTQIVCCNKHVEIIQPGACNAGAFLEYGLKDFMNKFIEILKINKFKVVGENAS